MKVTNFPIVCEGVFQCNKKGINMHIIKDTNGRQHIFQNHAALFNLNLKTTIQSTKTRNNNLEKYYIRQCMAIVLRKVF